jgi:hypothetical protein
MGIMVDNLSEHRFAAALGTIPLALQVIYHLR